MQGLARTARSLVKARAPCAAGGSTPPGGPRQMLPHREEVKTVHWLRMFLLAWLSLGTVTLVFLFWLCKRTAAAVKDPIKLGSLSPSESEFGTSNLSSKLRSA